MSAIDEQKQFKRFILTGLVLLSAAFLLVIAVFLSIQYSMDLYGSAVDNMPKKEQNE